MSGHADYKLFQYNIPENITIYNVPVVNATDETIKGFGEFVYNFNKSNVINVVWPKKEGRPLDNNTGDQALPTEGLFDFYYENKNVTPSWFGLPIKILVNKKKYKDKIIKKLEKNGVETRPIISGNFANQPAAKLYKLCKKNEKFENAQKVQELGFLIGLHTKKLSKNNLDLIHDSFFMIDNIYS